MSILTKREIKKIVKKVVDEKHAGNAIFFTENSFSLHVEACQTITNECAIKLLNNRCREQLNNLLSMILSQSNL